jgi:DNA-binding CsgD family transcriptional regulator
MKEHNSGYISFDAEVPQPIEKEVKGFVQYGKDNLYPQFLNSLYYDNPIHQGIINQKVMFALGDGLEGDQATLDNSVSKFSLDEVIEQVFYDLEIQEGYYLLFKWSVTDQVWYVENLPFELVRPNEELTRFAYSEDWTQSSQSEEKTGYKEYQSFWNPIKDDNGEIVSRELVMYIKPNSKQIKIDGTKKLTSNIFPIPSYSGAIVSIMAGIEMDWFHYAESVNGWSSNTIINMNNGLPETPEIKRELEESIKKRATDKKKKGGITILYNDGKERAADIVNMSGNGNDTKYLATQEHVMQTIMIGHGVQNPALFGLEVAGKLGNNDDNAIAYLRFMDTYVNRRRRNVIDSILYGLKTLNQREVEVQFKEYTPIWLGEQSDIENKVAETLNKMSPLLANSVIRNLTINEIRNIAGLEPIAGGDELNSDPDLGTTPEQMSAEIQESEVLALFSKVGSSKKGVQFVSGQAFKGQTDDECLDAFYSGQFSDLTGQQIKILNLINTGQSFQAIKEALKISAGRLAYEVMKLTVRGYVRDWKLTAKAEANVPRTEQIKVVYSYEKRPDLDGPSKLPNGRTREFCAALIDADRIYTREEIDRISTAIGRDVWSYRGGWYRNPNTERTTPSCRHFWKQNVIIDRNG